MTMPRIRKKCRRGSVLLMTMVYLLLFGAMATVMYALSVGNIQVERAETHAQEALAAAESGMSYLLLQIKTVNKPVITEGNISTMAQPLLLWNGTNVESMSGNNGIAVNLAAAFNANGAFTGNPVSTPSGSNALSVPAMVVDPAGDGTSFTLSVAWDSGNPHAVAGANTSYLVLHLTSVGKSGGISRTVTMDVWVQKVLKYAVYSNVAVQLGKNVIISGDVASAYGGTDKGPPVQMFSDWRYLPDSNSLENDQATLRTLLAQYDTAFSNRLDVRNSASPAAVAAAAAGLTDRNGDGYIDDYDVALKYVGTTFNASSPTTTKITSGTFTDPTSGQAYDSDLWSVVDTPLGAVNSSTGLLPDGEAPLWAGYGDGQIDNRDAYAKVHGSVKVAISQQTWQNNVSNWSAWGSTFRDQFEGPVVPSDPTQAPVQFGYDFSDDLQVTPQSFDTSGIASQTNTTNATKTTSGSNVSISGGVVTSSMANGGTVTEHFPSDVSSGWQATYKRPVFQNVNFTNVRIPKGLNAKFINCTFNGYTYVDMTTKIVDPTNAANTNSDGSTPDPSAGMRWAQQMTSGSFSANTTLTSSNSTAFQQGNNLHFSGCTFNGVMGAATPTAYTHFGNSWEFDGTTNINNQVDGSVTIMAPNTNIEMGSYVDPAANPSTLIGVVVAGNIDVRGSAIVDGSMIVAGNGAQNTTLGYFGTTDSGQAVPTLSQLPSTANGQYGHLYFRYNPNRGMPNGIKIPVMTLPQYATYQIQ